MSEPDTTHAPRRPRRAWPALAGAVAVVLVVAGALLAVRAADGGSAATGPAAAEVVAAPPGKQLVSSLGVQLAVPERWEVVGAIAGCGPLPDAAVVRGGGAVAGCGYVEPAGFTLVEIGTPASITEVLAADWNPGGPPAPGAEPSSSPVESLGMLRTRTALADGRTQLLLTSSERDVAVLLRGPDEAALLDIVDTIRLVDVDAAGCPSVLPVSPSWDRPDRRQGVPGVEAGSVSRVSVCAYSTFGGDRQRLAASTLLDGAAADDLAGVLDAAPAGALPAPPETDCLRDDTEEESVLLLLERAAGTTPVRVHHSGCRVRWVAAPGGVSQPTMALVGAAYEPLRMGWSVTGGLP